MIKKIKNIHMVGIGGAGMSGIAEVLLRQGYKISGSDLSDSATVRRLRELGAEISRGHDASRVGGAQVVIKSTAISDDNPEIIAARSRGVPVIPRAEMLAELMRLKRGVAIAGTHGKTTTTSLCAAIFEAAGRDPTVIIGGRLNVYGANAHLGEGEYLIAEADESDGSFLYLSPQINVITCIDNDHMDHYADAAAIDEAFLAFMRKAPFYGLNVVCGDDVRARKLLSKMNRPRLTYGFGEDNDLVGRIVESGPINRFETRLHGKILGEAVLPQPGRHNVLNALGAIGAAMAADISFADCARGLENFKGVGRRFEWKGEKGGVTVIDDYGHHPAEIAATVKAAREVYPARRLVAAFQPHRFSRTKAFFGEFCEILGRVDELLLTEIYAASETPLPGVTGKTLALGVEAASATPTRFYDTLDEMVAELDAVLKPGDVLLTLGAGSITKVGPAWLNA